ncbi:L,D-transpeptidase family protein [Bacteroides nordii]|jgi:murein L,D-transpeptidase YcbB/YkuD|uniref:L,D-transpeptidase family protein n=1 Tax=Bacteroides nordii TaxID=291645 RepID=UPI00241D2ACD|nr:L,D-transpeptidase family protein [Bacteroides nordii]MBD9111606.1 L,D-transpeptidase [Bacteroides nordii]
MMKRIVLSFLILLVVVSACKQEKPKFPVVLSLSSFHELVHPAYLINPDSIRQYVRVNLSNANDTMAWDSAMVSYYAADSAALFWMKDGVGQYADSLLYWLENSHRHGLNPALFNVSGIRTDLERFRSLQLHEDETINHLLARLEYGLTSSYLFYTCGLKYGFISPVQLLNNQEEDVKKKNDTEKQKEPYPIPLKKCSKEFALEALASLGQNPFAAFRQAQPTSPFYLSMQKELVRLDSIGEAEFEEIPLIGDTLLKVGERHRIIPLIAGRLMQTGELKQQVSGDTLTSVLLEAVNEFRLTNRLSTDNSIGTYTIRYLNRPLAYYKDHLLINLERARWQYKSEKGSKYVIGNIAAFMLQAFNEEVDSILEMRICCGSVRNKTPLLYSKIYYMELNPYWNVPQNIIRKEIIPSYRRDTTYFTRNRMKVYDKNGNRVNPHDIKWAKYTAGVPFTVKQDNKEGNSLGRIIFRFPNPYAVYLHDTPSRWAFNRSNRAVSHGCVRLERALDFAFFLLEKPDELLEDRIRIAMDIAPKSDEGKKLNRSEAYRELKHYSLKEAIPLFLDYQTMYLAADGKLSYCEDIYKYDDPLLEALNKLNHK